MSHDRREPKRARQACLNCRRKKARCSGEKPVCAFCARLKQTCEWDSPSNEASTRPSISKTGPGGRDAAGLAARVALLEAKLSLLSDRETIPHVERATASSSQNGRATSSRPKRPLPPEIGTDTSTYEGDYSSVPNGDIFRHLIDVYFEYIHNQPYAFFHESTFRRKYDQGQLPEYLILAFAATALRFSNHELYRGRQQEALTAYANSSWQQILDESFSHDGHLQFQMVQATAMLVVIDFTQGHTKLGWVKFSVTIRFAQGLWLNEEPDEDLPGIEQEERRRTFWSVYLLDVLLSLGPSRPASISNPDCPLRLPCQEDLFCNGLVSEFEPTLEAVINGPSAPEHQDLDYFAMMILMASALRRFVRYAMKPVAKGPHPAWEPHSEYSMVNRNLLHFESLSPCALSTVTETLQHQFTFDGTIDKQRAGHFLYSHAMFHMVHCLLNHPFVLYHVLEPCPAAIPPSWVEEALARCQKHAAELMSMLQDGQEQGRLASSCFYGYCALATGVIHRLFLHHEDPTVASVAHHRAEQALEFLISTVVRWPIFNNMILSLQAFRPSMESVRALIHPMSLASRVPVQDGSTLWHILDYAGIPEINPSSPEETGVMSGLLQEVIQQEAATGLEESEGYFAAADVGIGDVYTQREFGEGMAGSDLWPAVQQG